jgi:hypothetical protein
MMKHVLTIRTLFGLSACKTDRPSDVKLVNGKLDSDGRFRSVIQVRLPDPVPGQPGTIGWPTCSASIVSDTTLVTAAHCFDTGDTTKIEAVIDGQPSGKAVQSLSNPRYESEDFDIAVVVFPSGTFAKFTPFSIAQDRPQPGAEVTIVGFGNFDHIRQSGSGKKRWGTNTVKEIDNWVRFEGATSPVGGNPEEGTGNDVLNSQGDSGGPLLYKGELLGVSSSVSVTGPADAQGRPTSAARETGRYFNVLADLPFLRDAVAKIGAKITGLDGAKPEPGNNAGPSAPNPVPGPSPVPVAGPAPGPQPSPVVNPPPVVNTDGIVKCFDQSGKRFPCPPDTKKEFESKGYKVDSDL